MHWTPSNYPSPSWSKRMPLPGYKEQVQCSGLKLVQQIIMKFCICDVYVTVLLSWRVQNVIVIDRICYELTEQEHYKFSLNFEFDRNINSGRRLVVNDRMASCTLHWGISPIKKFILHIEDDKCRIWRPPSTRNKDIMMTSSNGKLFRVTDPLCGEFTGPGDFPTQRPVTRSFDVFFDLRLNKRLSKQTWGWCFETQSWSLWRQFNALISLNRLRPGLKSDNSAGH